MLKEIFAAAREQRWKFGRNGKRGGGDMDAEDSEDRAGSNGYWYACTERIDASLVK